MGDARYPTADALTAAARAIADAGTAPPGLRPVVVAVFADYPCGDTAAVLDPVVTITIAAHPGLVTAWEALGLARVAPDMWVAGDAGRCNDALAWVDARSVTVAGRHPTPARVSAAGLVPLRRQRRTTTPGRVDVTVDRHGAWRLTLDATGALDGLDRLDATATFDIRDALDVLAAAAVPVVDAGHGEITRLARRARRAAVARPVHGAPGLADVTVDGADARLDTVAAAALLARHDGIRPVACHPTVADTLAVATAAPCGPVGLRPVQRETAGAYRASRHGIACTLGPGTGKTGAALAAVAATGGVALVAVPAGVVEQWTTEAATRVPDLTVTVAATGDELTRLLARTGTHAVIATLQVVAATRPRPLEHLVVDEAWFLRNPSKRTTALWAWRRQAVRALPLTGSPTRPDDPGVAALVAFATGDPHLFTGWPLHGPGPSAPERIGPYCVGLTDPGTADLPPLARTVVTCVPDRAEEALIAAANDHAAAAHRHALAVVAAAGPTRMCAAARLADHRARTLAVTAACDPAALPGDTPAVVRGAADDVAVSARRRELVSRLADRTPTLVFCESATLARDLSATLTGAGRRAASLTGADRASLRARTAARLGDDLDVLVCAQVASEGLNLQAARTVIHYDTPPTAAAARQREGRACRLGGQPVSVTYLTTVGALDADTAAVLAAYEG